MSISSAFLEHLNQDFPEAAPMTWAERLSAGHGQVAHRLDSARGPLFIKTSLEANAALIFEREADGLRQLARHSSMPIPELFGWGQKDQEAYLLLAFLEPARPAADYAQRLGAGLAELHQTSSSKFGAERDNFLAAIPQDNRPLERWSEFWALRRIEGLFAQARDQGLLGRPEQRYLDRYLGMAEEILPPEAPALLHGDLWSGNVLCNHLGQPAWIDPAPYYGHRETDLAMMMLFGGFSEAVFEAYHQQFPLAPAWRDRLDYHQLYPLLVHLRLFGASYAPACWQILQRYGK